MMIRLSYRFLKMLVLSLLVLSFASVSIGAQILPVVESSRAVSPFSSVGRVGIEGEVETTGILIADNAVLTTARQYLVLSNFSDNSRFYWTQENGEANLQSQAATTLFISGYRATFEREGYESSRSKEEDLMLIVFNESLGDGLSPVRLGSDLSPSDDFRMVIGFPSGYYSSGDSGNSMLHATGAGESKFTDLNRVRNRLYHTGDLKIPARANGWGLFSLIGDTWVLSGLAVEGNPEDGSLEAVVFDTQIIDFINSGASISSESRDGESGTDANASADGALPLVENVVIRASIAPERDVDFHQFNITQEGEYIIESLGDLDLSGTLYNESVQLISSDDDSGGSFNYRFEVLLQPGTYYLRSAPFSTQETGDYQVVFKPAADTRSFLDEGIAAGTLMNLQLGAEDLDYQISESGEKDYFLINADTDGHLIFAASGEVDLNLRLIDPASSVDLPISNYGGVTTLAQSDDFPGLGSDAVMDAFVATGTYWVEVSPRNSGEFGAYSVSSKFHFSDWSLSENRADVEAIQSSTLLKIGDQNTYGFSGDGEVHTYSFYVQNSSVVEITPKEGIQARLYSSNFDSVEPGSSGLDWSVSGGSSAALYHLVVTGSSAGDYQVSITEN